MSILQLYTPEQVASMLNVAVGTLSNWRHQRRSGDDVGPPYVRINGSSIRYPEDSLKAWLLKKAEGGK